MTPSQRRTIERARDVMQRTGILELVSRAAELDALLREGEAEPVAWVIPGDDTARDGGWLDARIDREGEFTKPLYATPPSPEDAPE